jgi:aryl-alcohol dehydrogenase-like predicted oxidoreductase
LCRVDLDAQPERPYDRGIRFFETAEAYQTPGMLGEALRGLPRDSYHLMSKVTTFHQGIDPQAKFDELRRISQTELLRHHVAALATRC